MTDKPKRIRVTLDFRPGRGASALEVAMFIAEQMLPFYKDGPWYLTSGAEVRIVGVMEQED